MKASKKEPLFRIAKRNVVNWKTTAIAISSCIGGALLISILFLWVVSMKNPFTAVKYIFQGTFQNKIKLWAAIKEWVLLLGIGLALVPAYKMKFWNIGAQGQVLIGALITTIFMIKLGNTLPSYLIIILSIVCSFIGGALWAWIPAFFKSKWNTNETLFTLMMNYIAVFVVTFFVDNWRGSKTALGTINQASKVGWVDFKTGVGAIDDFIKNYGNSKVIIPMLFVILLVVFMFFYIRKTKHGYEIQMVGDSVSTAKYTGVNVGHVIRRTLFLSGAICGIIGFFYVSAFDHTLSAQTGGGYGFTAVIVCWLSNFNPFVMIAYSFLIIFLNKGSRNLSNVGYAPALNEYSTEFLVFVIIIAIMLATFFIRYHIVFTRKKTEEEKQINYLTRGLLKGDK